MTKRTACLPLLLLGIASFLNCSEPSEDLPRLEFLASMPRTLTAGDTTAALNMRKVGVDALGKQTRNDAYGSFTFVSSDTAILKVVENRRLLGIAAGQASLSASDNLTESGGTRSSLTVTVQAAL